MVVLAVLDSGGLRYEYAHTVVFLLRHLDSRGDRYLSHSSRHTQVPVPATTSLPLSKSVFSYSVQSYEISGETPKFICQFQEFYVPLYIHPSFLCAPLSSLHSNLPTDVRRKPYVQYARFAVSQRAQIPLVSHCIHYTLFLYPCAFFPCTGKSIPLHSRKSVS